MRFSLFSGLAPRPPIWYQHRNSNCRELRSACFKPSRTKTRFLRRRDALWPGRSPLLETFAAIYRASLCRLERNGCFFSALRAHRLGFDTLYAAGTCRRARRAISLARLAPLGLVLEALVGEKHLLAGGENELSRTFSALQNPVMVFHTLLQSLAGTGVAAEQFLPEACGRVPGKFTPPSFPPAEPFEWTPVIWSPSLAHAVAFFGDAYARGPLWHGAFHLVSCSSCAF